MEKAHEITLAELFVGYDKEHPSERRPGNLTERLAPKIKVELSKQWPAIDWDSLKESIEDNAVAMLHIPVITDILLPAWREYQDLEGRISDDPEGKVIWLAQHTVSSVHHPHLDVRCYGVRRAQTVRLDVAANFTLNGFGLVVESGRIRKIRTGTMEGTGSVAFKDLKLEKRFGKIELMNEIGLGEGIPLSEPHILG